MTVAALLSGYSHLEVAEVRLHRTIHQYCVGEDGSARVRTKKWALPYVSSWVRFDATNGLPDLG